MNKKSNNKIKGTAHHHWVLNVIEILLNIAKNFIMIILK